MKSRNSVFFAALVFAAPLAADTLILNDGTEIPNVRTWVTKGQVHMVDRTGKTRSFAEAEVKSIRPAAVNWDAPTAAEGPRPFWKHPAALALQGAVPGWSGLYFSDRPYLGVPFTIAEIYLLGQTLRWFKEPVPIQEDLRSPILIASFVAPPPPGMPAVQGFNAGFFTDATVRLAITDQVKAPNGGYMARDKYDANKKLYSTMLGLTLAADALISFLMAPAGPADRETALSPRSMSVAVLPEETVRGTGRRFQFQAVLLF